VTPLRHPLCPLGVVPQYASGHLRRTYEPRALAARRRAPAAPCPRVLVGSDVHIAYFAATMIGAYAVVQAIPGIYFDYRPGPAVLPLENGAVSGDGSRC